MKTYIALFRGINIGGHNLLAMKELTALLEKLGLRHVKTYIQSGNAVFRCREQNARRLSEKISVEIMKRRGFAPRVLVLEPTELEKVIASNPFPEAGPDPKSLHVLFLLSAATAPDLTALESLRGRNERFWLQGCVFYLHAPDGVGRSKLAAGAERLIGVPLTGRNWRSVIEILEMAKDNPKRDASERSSGAGVPGSGTPKKSPRAISENQRGIVTGRGTRSRAAP